jgi:hypothetical protein
MWVVITVGMNGKLMGMTTGDLIQSAARKGGAEAEIEAVVSDAISQRRKAA